MKVVNERSGIISELYAPYRVNFNRKRVEIKGLSDLIEADLADLSRLKKHNKNFAYILLATNPFSKMIYCRKLKTKKTSEVAQAMKSILEETKLKFKNLFTDAGGEFFGKIFQDVIVKPFKLNHYTTKSKIKATHAERKIKDLKRNLYIAMDLRGTMTWIDLLDDVTKKLNSTPHSRYKFIPIKVNKKNAKDIQRKFYDEPRDYNNDSRFKVGDKVRISELPLLFRRVFRPFWSIQIYTIKQINLKIPQTYRLVDYKNRDLKRSYYTEEIKKTNYPDTWLVEKVIKTKGSKSLVRWFGFESEDDSWVDSKDIFDKEK